MERPRFTARTVLKILAYIGGVAIETLYFLFPTDTVTLVEATLGLSGVVIVEWILKGLAIVIAIGLIIATILAVKQHFFSKQPRTHGHLDYIEGRGPFKIGLSRPEGEIGILQEKGSFIKKLKRLTVISEGGPPPTGVVSKGKIEEIEDVTVRYKRRGFWSRLLGQ